MPSVEVAKDYVEYSDEHLYHVKITYGYNDPDNLVNQVHEWVVSNFDAYEYDTFSAGRWYITTSPSTFALAFKLTWEGP